MPAVAAPASGNPDSASEQIREADSQCKWSINGGLLSRQVMTATLAADHRVSDGRRGGDFLNAIARLLQEPEKL